MMAKQYLVIDNILYLKIDGTYVDLVEENAETISVWERYEAQGAPFMYYHPEMEGDGLVGVD